MTKSQKHMLFLDTVVLAGAVVATITAIYEREEHHATRDELRSCRFDLAKRDHLRTVWFESGMRDNPLWRRSDTVGLAWSVDPDSTDIDFVCRGRRIATCTPGLGPVAEHNPEPMCTMINGRGETIGCDDDID